MPAPKGAPIFGRLASLLGIGSRPTGRAEPGSNGAFGLNRTARQKQGKRKSQGRRRGRGRR